MQICKDAGFFNSIRILAFMQLFMPQLQSAAVSSLSKGYLHTNETSSGQNGVGASVEELLNLNGATTSPVRGNYGEYEIFSLSGEPNYKSVDLTWETQSGSNEPTPKTFEILICELQTFGLNRCRSKLVDGSRRIKSKSLNQNIELYRVHIDNLRMATTFVFNIRQMEFSRNVKINDNEVDKHFFGNGHSIIVPTKGFEAVATRCLPHASEIEVETGPYFGGRIAVDGDKCIINGNRTDPAKKYTMRIDHKTCGSVVKPLTKTVETFITVQENLGIFTHSTRRFLVICSFQSGMQTVRASFTIPGKKEVVSVWSHDDPFYPDERIGREHQQTRFVNKSLLVLKETEGETQLPTKLPESVTVALHAATEKTTVAFKKVEEIKPNIKIENENSVVRPAHLVKFAELVLETAEANENPSSLHKFGDSALIVQAYNGSVVFAVFLSVIILCLMYVAIHKARRHHIGQQQYEHTDKKCAPL